MPVARLAGLLVPLTALTACGDEGRCGPASGRVVNVVDGDTVDLESGERIRYLGADTPEVHGQVDCFGPEAQVFNTDLVLDREVTLEYDTECTDRYGRLLAYVSVEGRMVNRLLVERGYARVLIIEPNHKYADELNALEDQARAAKAGLWGTCE
jgi:micrococcal nuclease